MLGWDGMGWVNDRVHWFNITISVIDSLGLKLLSNVVCSNYISPLLFFNAIFRLRLFDFSSSKTG